MKIIYDLQINFVKKIHLPDWQIYLPHAIGQRDLLSPGFNINTFSLVQVLAWHQRQAITWTNADQDLLYSRQHHKATK